MRGNTKTSTRVVLRYVPFSPGDVINVESPSVELSRFRLLGTGFFRSVEFSLKKGSARGLVVLVIDVVERAHHRDQRHLDGAQSERQRRRATRANR